MRTYAGGEHRLARRVMPALSCVKNSKVNINGEEGENWLEIVLFLFFLLIYISVHVFIYVRPVAMVDYLDGSSWSASARSSSLSSILSRGYASYCLKKWQGSKREEANTAAVY